MKISYLSLGSNIGNREKNIENSIQLIQKIPNLVLLEISKFLETKALEVTNQPKFINAIIKIKTDLEPPELLTYLKQIEKTLGRKFRYNKGPREIDIDILIYEKVKINQASLKIPHPALQTRPFLLEILKNMKDQEYLNFIEIQEKKDSYYD